MNTWAQRVVDLEGRGWSLTGIGQAIDLSPQAVSDIKQGRTKEPRGMSAVKLHELYGRVMGSERAAASEEAA